MRLLLINPRFPESFWSFRWALENILPGKRTLNPPLGLATLAALCPPHWEVEIVDENVEPVPLNPEADLIGVCGMGVQFSRQKELLSYYRERGHPVVAGGSYASLCPERYQDIADTVVAGEAEYIWPAFCRDFERGEARALYQETGTVDLEDSPTPRFDLLKLERYSSVSLQFSRGCPYRCDFCDIIVMFGRRPRTKSLAQVEKELDLLRGLGAKKAFFVDDNLIGNKAVAKNLLRFLGDYQRRHDYRFSFGTEVSLNLAEDEELLSLCRDAHFGWVFIGIESPDPDSLKETKKTQNMRQDILGAVRTIYSYGIDILAGFIVGFDNDTLESFEGQRRFITRSGIQVAMVGLLTALPKTPLYQRLEKEGRLLPEAQHGDNTKAGTNFLPLRMDYDAMVEGYKALHQQLSRDSSIAERIRAKTRFLTSPVDRGGYPPREALAIVARLVTRGLLPGGPRRLYHFVRTLAACRPTAWPLAVNDWIAGLAMQDYVRRHLATNPIRDRRLAEAMVRFVRRSFPASLHRGALEISLRPADMGARLALTLRGAVDRRFFKRSARRLHRGDARGATQSIGPAFATAFPLR
jgi:radical SAM superfamily enzyme YgiQ (UPF0313 family)